MRRVDGFTLFELLIALAILAAAWAMAAPALTSAGGAGSLARDAERAAAALREARSLAIAANRPVGVVFNLEEKSISIDGAATSLFDPQTEWTLTTAGHLITPGAHGAIVFQPDGGSTGGQLTLRRGNATRLVVVDWLIGTTEVRLDR